MFSRRARELFITTRVDSTIDENVAILRDLDATVGTLVHSAETEMEAGVGHVVDAPQEVEVDSRPADLGLEDVVVVADRPARRRGPVHTRLGSPQRLRFRKWP